MVELGVRALPSEGGSERMRSRVMQKKSAYHRGLLARMVHWPNCVRKGIQGLRNYPPREHFRRAGWTRFHGHAARGRANVFVEYGDCGRQQSVASDSKIQPDEVV